MLANTAIKNYHDEATGVFFYTSDDEQLIARKSEIMDNVTPASNSMMARNLHQLGLLFDNEKYTAMSAQLLCNISPNLVKYASAYSNWSLLLLEEVFGTFEVAITGDKAEDFRKDIEQTYIPNKLILGGKQGTLPLLQDRFGDHTRIFICRDKTCGLPADNPADAIEQMS